MESAQHRRAHKNTCNNLTHDSGLPDFDKKIAKQLGQAHKKQQEEKC